MAKPSNRLEQAEQAGTITRSFRGLRGYTMLPWLPPLLLWWGSEAGVLRGSWWLPAFLTSVALAIVGTRLIGRWYARNYGEVRLAGTRHLRRVGFTVVAVLGAWVLIVGLGAAVRWPADLASAPVGWVALAVGLGWTVASGWRPGPLTATSWWFGLVVAGVALVPLGWLPALQGHPFNADGAVIGIVAAFVLVVGIGSHRALARALPEPGESAES